MSVKLFCCTSLDNSLEARKIDSRFITVIHLTNIGLHQISCVLSVKRIVCAKKNSVKEIIKHIDCFRNIQSRQEQNKSLRERHHRCEHPSINTFK